MMCRNPYNNSSGQLYPCGQCLPCRINRGRLWTHRIMLEAGLNSANTFLTLTYADAHLRKSSEGLPSLDPRDLSNFLKRFRKTIEPLRIRYFACGEYGTETWRPHYHAIIFNFETCRRGRTLRYVNTNRPNWEKCCDQCQIIGKSWGLGDVDLGTVETSSAQYVCGYVTKKMTSHDDMRLKGRYPEFARMSRKPGLGLHAMHEVASTLLQFDLETRLDDVPSSLRHGSRTMPLGSYLTRNLRKMVGKDEKAPQATLDKIQEELRPMRETAFDNSRSFKKEVVKAHDQKVLNQETRRNIHKQRKSL